jgi:hypothetical protein
VKRSGVYHFSAVKHVGIQRFAVAEQADHDGQADAASAAATVITKNTMIWPSAVPERAPNGDEAQVDRVQHDLDREQDGDEIPPNEDAGRAESKTESRTARGSG